MHDRNGTELKKGDIVLVEAEVTELQPQADADYCNVNLRPVKAGTVNGETPMDGGICTCTKFLTLLKRPLALIAILAVLLGTCLTAPCLAQAAPAGGSAEAGGGGFFAAVFGILHDLWSGAVWPFLLSPAFVGLIALVIARMFAARPLWEKYAGTIIAGIKYAEKQVPDDSPNKSVQRLDAALKYVLRVYEQTKGAAATPAEAQQLAEGIQITHADLEAAGNLDKPYAAAGGAGGNVLTTLMVVGCLAALLTVGGCSAMSPGQQYVIASNSYATTMDVLATLRDAGMLTTADRNLVTTLSDQADVLLDEMAQDVLADRPVNAATHLRRISALLDDLLKVQLQAEAAKKAAKSAAAPPAGKELGGDGTDRTTGGAQGGDGPGGGHLGGGGAVAADGPAAQPGDRGPGHGDPQGGETAMGRWRAGKPIPLTALIEQEWD